MKTCLILEGFAFFMLQPENSLIITNDSVRQPVALKKNNDIRPSRYLFYKF